jgi:glycine reductase
MLPVAQMVGSNRIVPGNGIVHPTGDAERTPDEERRIRRRLVEEALVALTQR